MKLTNKIQKGLAQQFVEVTLLERAVAGMADVLPLTDSEILQFTNLLAEKTLAAHRKEREAVNKYIERQAVRMSADRDRKAIRAA
jgi:hypothetical protein